MADTVKIRFLAQGILTIPAEDLPENWKEMTPGEAWEWATGWWEEEVTQEMLNKGLVDCDSDAGEVQPGLLEVLPGNGDEYHTLAITNEFYEWFYGGSGMSTQLKEG